jgi:hypothetical protein
LHRTAAVANRRAGCQPAPHDASDATYMCTHICAPTYCHGKIEGKEAMPKNLNDAGTYYKGHDHKLDGYVPKK